jgi:hypothetical protein
MDDDIAENFNQRLSDMILLTVEERHQIVDVQVASSRRVF